MLKCILNVTEHEYDRILQLNHDAVVWKNSDQHLLEGLESLLGKEVADQLRKFDECRMEKHTDTAGGCRVQSV